MLLTQEQVRELFDYDAEEGALRWRVGRSVGQIAGTIGTNGYQMVQIRRGINKVLYGHRLIWLWVHGEFVGHIDHINGDRTDNRLRNLRLATQSQNLANQKGRAKSGFKGVWQHGRGWAASVRKDKKTHHLGSYPTPELAHAAYCEAAKKLHGEFARVE